jgi:dolichol-phosphate mannosyltransferase
VLLHIGIVIPTYNESENLPGLVAALLALPLDVSILIVDDNSPDGSGAIADQLAVSSSGRVNVLHRSQKMGIASAYVQGFRSVLEKKVEAVAQMDGDFSHDPAALLSMVKCLEQCDVVFGSRYTTGGSVDNRWPFWRKGLSSGGNFYARTILRIPLRDVTTGFRLWRSETIRGLPFDDIQSKGYVFQVEMAYLAHCLEYHMKEMPVYFADRHHGKSKMSLQIQMEAAFRIWQIWLTHRHLCHMGQAARAHSERSEAVI